MGKETKEKGKHRGKKITQFPTQLDVQEELEDVAMDRFLRQSIIEDADRIERELNEDPKLIGIGASDDLFGKIVEELKTKGIWEDEKKTKVDEKPEPAKEEQQNPAVYDMLSEADREALAFGYQMQKKEQERKEKRKKRNRRLKHVSAAMVALVFVGGIGLSTEASRRWIFTVRDVVLGNLSVGLKSDFVEDEADIRSLSNEEEMAIEDIKKRIDVKPIKFLYLPVGMEFSFYECDEYASCANVFYSYKDINFSVYMRKNTVGNVFYYQIDDLMKKKEVIKTQQNIPIQLYERDYAGEKTYLATFEVNDNYYYCSGAIEYGEILKILKYLMIV